MDPTAKAIRLSPIQQAEEIYENSYISRRRIRRRTSVTLG